MDTSPSPAVAATPDLLTEAERLIRSLAGVINARIHASEDRDIDAIHVDVADPGHVDAVAAHVRSALLAGLATPITAARIHVRVVDAPPPAPPHDQPPRHRIRLVQDAQDREDAGAAAATPRDAAPGTRDADHTARTGEERSVTERPRLVAVDIERPGDGRVLCSVAVAYRTRLHRADAVAVDLPGAAAQAAAQAAVRALTDAGMDGLELDGLREVEIAGRDYVLVALRRTGTFTRVRSGSAPITGAPERAAALAAVDAAEDMT